MPEGIPIAREAYDIPSVDRREVLRYLGHRGQAISPELEGRIDEGVARAIEVARPAGVWRVFDVEPAGSVGAPGAIRLAGCSLELPGADIAEHLAGARSVGVMAVTLGAGIDRELARLAAFDQLGQVILDAAATTLVERAADACEARVRAAGFSGGLYANGRFSPGYGDLPLAVQPSLLATLDAQRRLGLTLTESDLLVPTKSVTAVLGLFDSVQPTVADLCVKCHCYDFCTIRATGRTCRG